MLGYKHFFRFANKSDVTTDPFDPTKPFLPEAREQGNNVQDIFGHFETHELIADHRHTALFKPLLASLRQRWLFAQCSRVGQLRARESDEHRGAIKGSSR